MNEETLDRLMKKGWTYSEIKDADNIIEARKIKDKSGSSASLTKVIYWVALIITIIGNMLISVILIPFLLILSNAQLYLIIAIVGLMFGFIFNLLINDIENLEKTHHIIAGVFIPAIAIINVFLMVRISNIVSVIVTKAKLQQNPVLISIIYVGAFIAPYLYTKYVKDALKNRKRSAPIETQQAQ